MLEKPRRMLYRMILINNPETGCYDGAKNAKFRGINRNPVFYTDAYFLIRSIKVFQNDQINQKV